MRAFILRATLTAWSAGFAVLPAFADETLISAGLNAPVIGASGGSQVYWGPIVTQTTMGLSGNTNTNYPQKLAGSSISGSGGAAGSREYCQTPGPDSGPGTVVPPSSVPVYEWFCNQDPVPAAPQVDFEYYKYLAQLQGNSCGGQPCYNAGTNLSFSGIYDPICTVNGQTKVWFFEGDVSFSGGTYFCGILLSRGSVGFTGGGAGNVTITPHAEAWKQYQVATPNGTPGFGDTSAQDEYPGDGGLNTAKPYNLATGGGGFNGDPVSFKGYIYATTGYTAGGHTLVVGAVQFGQGAASTAGGGTIFYDPQVIFTVPPSGSVARPVITPGGGSFTGNVSVTITVATAGAEIRYTLDGTTPNPTSPLYTGAFTLTSDTVVKAIGIRSDLNPSEVATANFVITPGPANQPPVVDAGPNQTIVLPASASLAGTASDDGLPNPPASLTYAWNRVSGPGTVLFANQAVLSTTAVFSQSGTYVLRLAVFDGQLTTTDDITISVQDTPPPTVAFNPASYSVSEDDGYVRLTAVRSGTNLSGTSSVQFTTVNGTAVSGLDYGTVLGTLTFNPGETSKALQVPVLVDRLNEGSEVFTVTLTQPVGAVLGTSQAQVTITDASPAPPPAPAPLITRIDPYTSPVDVSFSFTMRVLGSGFDAQNAQVLWNNGTTLPVLLRSSSAIYVTVNPSLWNNTQGAYPILVRNPGNIDSNSVNFYVGAASSITVTEMPPWVVQPPAADPNPTYGTTSTLTVLGGTFSPMGEAVLSYKWEAVGSQPAGYTFSANSSHAASRSVVAFSGPGVYRFRAVITDTYTGIAIVTDTLDVTVVSRATSLVLSPKRQVITLDQTATLNAVVRDQFGAEISPTLNWTNSAGALSPSNTSAVLSVDPNSRNIRVTAALTDGSLTDYADVTVLYGAGGIGDLSQSVPAPVPFKVTSGLPGVTFKRLNPGTTIRLYTPDGKLVRTLKSEDGSDVLFDLKNSNGERVASGVYLYQMEGSGQKKKGKIVLIL
jgi:hypothetical protein